MEIMPKNEMVTSSKRTKLGVTQAVIECKLPVNNDTQVSKILCASAKSYISAFEANNGEEALEIINLEEYNEKWGC